ncbi:pseudouridine synthase [Atractiella rhizophila]|nr:pseudouridine synthase [Atractiella rhizophila]
MSSKRQKVTKYKGHGTRREMNSARVAAEGEDVEEGGRLPKKKVALLFGYVGHGYNGSQVNPDAKTIEGDIFQALVDAGCVSKDNAVNPTKVALNRTARTDAGVHAALNCISLKMILNPSSLTKTLEVDAPLTPADLLPENVQNEETTTSEPIDDSSTVVPQKRPRSTTPSPSTPAPPTPEPDLLISHLNSYLPSAIRLWRYVRVQNSFNPRILCDSRSYEYSLPTYVFLAPHPCSAAGKRFHSSPRSAGDPPEVSFWDGLSEAELAEGAIEPPPASEGGKGWIEVEPEAFWSRVERMRKWRISDQMLKRIRETVKQYEGTNKFHNFTIGKTFKDNNARRTMRSLTVTDPVLVDGTEWITINVHGQSFMLHQIRKMVGLIILLCRSCTPASLIAQTFLPSRLAIPKAPALGLILDRPHFSGYNKRVRNLNETVEKNAKAGKLSTQQAEDGKKEELLFESLDDRIGEFKRMEILPRMQLEEAESFPFAKWTSFLDSYTGDAYLYFNREGVIPDAARMDGKTSIFGVNEPGLQSEGEEEEVSLSKEDEGEE